jgi:hypothetical protein
MTEYFTGYIYTTDYRKWPMASYGLVLAEAGQEHRYYLHGPVIDQGQTNSCVGQTSKQWMQTAPRRTMVGPSGWQIYQRCLQVDNIPGEGDTGTTLQAMLKVLQEQGRVSSYLWAESASDIKNWILLRGPVIVGTTLTTNMRDLKNGYMVPTGNPIGGHAYLIIGYSKSRDAFLMVNSWGMSWGFQGKAWIRFGDMDTLLRGQGEAVGIIEKGV